MDSPVATPGTDAANQRTSRRARWYAALLLVGSVGTIYLAWRWLGVVGIVLSAPLLGLALVKPLLALVATGHRLARAGALHGVQGCHFEHRGYLIHVTEDTDLYRWLRTEDVRKVIKGLPGDAVLQRLFPGEVERGRPAHPCRIKAEALLRYLRKSSDPASLKFRNWLAAEVVLPADRRRAP